MIYYLISAEEECFFFNRCICCLTCHEKRCHNGLVGVLVVLFLNNEMSFEHIRMAVKTSLHMHCQIITMIPRNLQQDLLNGPLNLSI